MEEWNDEKSNPRRREVAVDAVFAADRKRVVKKLGERMKKCRWRQPSRVRRRRMKVRLLEVSHHLSKATSVLLRESPSLRSTVHPPI